MLVILLLFSTTILNFIEAKELKFVQAIWRHGDRSPTKLPYPNDPYDESYWPQGWSQLTDIGVAQLEELGTFFRDRYVGNFLNESYRPSEIYVQSSDSDRALSSAQAFLDGMFEVNQCGINGNRIRKPPIPIHSSGAKLDDYLLKPTSTDCPEYDKHYNDKASKKLDQIAIDYADLFAFLANVTGYGNKLTVKKAGKIANVQKEFFCTATKLKESTVIDDSNSSKTEVNKLSFCLIIEHGLKQPEWIYKNWPQYDNKTTLEIVTEIDRKRRLNEFEEEKLHRFRGGFLLGDWLQRARQVAQGLQKHPSKMMLYSSHDGTLLSLLFSLKIADNEQVPYASAIIMEIYENNGRFEAEIYYRKNKTMILKTIPGCGETCEVEELYNLLKINSYFTLKEVQEECILDNILHPSHHKVPTSN